MKKHKAILAIFICICLLTPPCFQLSTIGKIHAEMDYALGEVLSSPDTHISANVMDNAECGELYAQLMSSTTPAEAQALLSLSSDAYPESFRDIMLANENVALGGHENLYINDEQQDNGTEDVDDTPDFIGVAPLVDTPSGIFGSGEGNQISASGNDAVSLVKYATANEDGSYTITLEAWVNGMAAATASDPLDIVLVLTHSSEDGCDLRNSELRDTLKDFCDRIKEQSADGTKHRIAIVGHDDGDIRYESVFQNMATRKGQKQINEIISAIDLGEAVQLNVGLEMAEEVLKANPIKKSDDRKRVVIVLSDGVPCVTDDWDAQSTDAANSALTIARKIKNSGVTVYTVGIFEGANGSTENLPKFDSDGENNATKVANRLMHLLSSNYPNAKSMASKGKINTNARDGRSYYLSATDANVFNGVLEGICSAIIGSANLTAAARIKDFVSVYFTLPEVSAIRVYTADANANTNVETNENWNEPVLHNDFDVSVDEEHRMIKVFGFNYSENEVTSPHPHSGTTDVYGKKLIIQYDLVPEPGFIGGNNVPVDELGESAIFQNDFNNIPVAIFPDVKVNVFINEFSVSTEDKNVYLFGNLGIDDFEADAEAWIDAHGVDFNLFTFDEIGLDDLWMTAFVTISYTIEPSDLKRLTDDVEYELTVTVEPRPSNTDSVGEPAVTRSGSDRKWIYVFKPLLSFMDNEGYYGQNNPNPIESSYKHLYWEHGTFGEVGYTYFEGNKGKDVPPPNKPEMIGEEPTINVGYSYPTLIAFNPIISGDNDTYLVASKTFPIDVQVKIGTVNINDHAYFEHVNLAGEVDDRYPANASYTYEFDYYVNTCSITINKNLLPKDGNFDPEQTFIFKVCYEGIVDGIEILPYAEYNVAVENDNERPDGDTSISFGTRTIVGLPVGTYTVIEDGDWSWRYEQTSITPSGVTLSPSHNSDEVIAINTLDNPNWLGDEAVATNVFNSSETREVYTPNVPVILPKKGGDR